MAVSPLMDRKNKGGITRSQVHHFTLMTDLVMRTVHCMLCLQLCRYAIKDLAVLSSNVHGWQSKLYTLAVKCTYTS